MVHRSTRLIAACLTVSFAGGVSVVAQTRERIAFVSVVDRATGTPKDDLSARDIVIREDEATREVLRVTPATGPFPIAILVDTSASAEPAIPDIRAALTAFVGALGHIGPVSIVGFGERPTLLTDYTSAPATLAAGIGRVFARPGTGATLVDAVFETATGLSRREGERAAIVVLSAATVDQDNIQFLRALERLRESGASLHAVTLTRPGLSAVDRAARDRDSLLDRGVRATGGTRRDVVASMGFTAAMVDVARVLTHQSRVVYARPASLIPPDTFVVTAAAPGFSAFGGVARGQPK